MFDIEWTKQARKDVERLDATMRRRVRDAVDALRTDPFPHGTKPVKSQPGVWRIRIGDFRVLYEVHEGKLVVLILRVVPRQGAYD